MQLHKLILTKNPCYQAGRTIVPKGIMVHSTGANNPNLKRYIGPDDGLLGKNIYGNHWNRANQNVCVHAFIGKLKDSTIATYQTLPWDHRGWHCGAAANNTHISFEICEDNRKDAAYFGKVYQEAVELCAYLCELYNLDPLADGVIIDHNEGHDRGVASNHGDISHWWPRHGKSMDTFRADVAKLMGGNAAREEKAVPVYLRTLWRGAAGADVTALQMLLLGSGFSCGKWGADGDFGNATETALKAYQRKNNLTPDGVAGPLTWSALLGIREVSE